MKQVLVGIDFSKNSLHALEYAVNFAGQAGAGVTMVWVNNAISQEYIFDALDSEMKKEKKENFEKLIREFKHHLPKGNIDYKLRKGKVHLEMNAAAKASDADIIIAGTHGISGFEEYWIGSNAYRIVTHAPCPVITLRYDFPFSKTIRKIIFPIDNSQETKQKLPVVSEIANLFNAGIHILALYTTSLKSLHKRVDNFVLQTEEALSAKGIPSTTEKMQTDNMVQSTIDVAKSQEADLIAIMTEQENTTANIFLGPYAQQLINHSPIPILSIRSKKLM
ncbi:MAG: universal stress protein [Bacteroidetes bacterium]|nr:universal stress protein [Bacteroidota bacterium]